ncbi:30S ribosomal protein S15 [Coxiella endosymbiont of Amblyomma sculptum]|uniref:30S ribosomal protein S15 n=1 Tax=Coxiella endosymbiont of Amblyomma sculptum TaxID=2487929 RepID=UPI00132ED07A|nr:30S ribosomal protein S15 [Coxiella endosymbiont of Amblyomma sculptum]QHG92721.1 30S ribosomal protein S15 [Coxiella endosymbiont of Amblyomma sculptum]
MSLTSKETGMIIKTYQRHKNDIGSSEVQIAILSGKISSLAEHFRNHKKDHHSRRGLLRIVNRRRKILDYLKRNDTERYQKLIKQLKLRS